MVNSKKNPDKKLVGAAADTSLDEEEHNRRLVYVINDIGKTKKCNTCHKELPIEDFRLKLRTPNKQNFKKPYAIGDCRVCEYDKKINRYYIKRYGKDEAEKRMLRDRLKRNGIKICGSCEQSKPATLEFFRGRSSDGGLRTDCRECERIASNKYNRENYDTYFAKNYGLTTEEYQDLIIKQDNRCAICNRHSDEVNIGRNSKYTNLHVDHCHKTGKVRGLLCSSCNTALGKFQDDSDRLIRAAEYVNR